MTLHKWLRAADVEDGVRPGVSVSESAELRELKRRNRLLEQENEVLRPRRRTSRRRICREMMYPLVRDLAAGGVPVAVACRMLKLARAPYYRWRANPVTACEVDEAYLANVLFDAHRNDPEFGYRLLADEAAQAGLRSCDRRVWRICRDNRW